MAIATFSCAADGTNASTFYNWAHRISAAISSFGWTRAFTTNQIVWPASIIFISNGVGTGSVITFTYTLQQGSALRIGMSIKITGFVTNPGYNTTYTIQSLPTGSTFTVNGATSTSESPASGRGGVDVQVAITNAIGNGNTNTYTFTNTDGLLVNGQTIVITGCTSPGFNGTYVVASINSGAGTFTTTTGITHISEVETATGIVTSNSVSQTQSATTLPPSTGNLNEYWQMTDALQSVCPVYMEVSYGGNPGLQITVGAAIDTAGNFLGSTSQGSGILPFNQSTQTTTPSNSWMSGDTNRIAAAMWPGTGNERGGYWSIERSHDSSGNDTGEYFSLLAIGGGNSTTTVLQATVSPESTSDQEGKWAVITQHSVASNSFNGSTLISPVFPLFGAIGFPMINILVGKKVDWTDQVTVTLPMYGTNHTYRVTNTALTNSAGLITYDTTPTCCFLYRYE